MVGGKCCISIFTKSQIDINLVWISYGKRMPFCVKYLAEIEKKLGKPLSTLYDCRLSLKNSIVSWCHYAADKKKVKRTVPTMAVMLFLNPKSLEYEQKSLLAMWGTNRR